MTHTCKAGETDMIEMDLEIGSIVLSQQKRLPHPRPKKL